jgi:very-short-patch-repair endonuclease
MEDGVEWTGVFYMTDFVWKMHGITSPTSEYRFHPIRRWRFDYAWEDRKIAVEIEGGIWTRGAHTRGVHFISDCEKYNTATKMGWQVYRFTPAQLRRGEAQVFMKEILIEKETR